MRLWDRFRSWWNATLRRSRTEREMDAELRFHIEVRAEDLVNDGVPREEAQRRARLEFGGVEQTKEECRDARGTNTLESFVRDTRFGLRMLRKSPGFTFVAVLTLALGIGANTAIFSAVNALLFRPLPVKDIEHLAFCVALREGFDPFGTSLLEYEAFRDRNHSLSSMGLALQRSFNLTDRGDPERIQGADIQAEYLTTLGVDPILGRSFTPEENRPGGPAVALLGYGLWRRRFGGDPRLIGQSLNLEGQSTIVVGILPPAFDLPNATEIWVPLQTSISALPIEQRAAHDHELVARLQPRVTLAQADAELKGITRSLEREYPQVRSGWSVTVIGLREELLGDLTGRTEKAMFTLMAAVAFLLFICCANVASLLLARGVAREREIALRRALGAGHWRIIRQLMTESSLLAVVGGMAGLLLAYSIIPLLSVLNPLQTVGFAGPLRDLHIDARVLFFAALVTLLTALICALGPVLKAAVSGGMIPEIRKGGQRGNIGNIGRRWLAVLVVAEIAVAVPLLAGGSLIIQSFQRLQRVELGFRPDRLLTMHLVPSPRKYPQHRQRVAFVQQLLQRVKSVPGVVSVGITTNIPLSTFISYDSVFMAEGHPPLSPSDVPITAHRLVSPEYLQALGVTLVSGRLLNEFDRANTQPVVVISEELARQAWPGEDAIGKRIKRVRPGHAEFPWMTVVGVVKDVKEDRFNFRIDRPAWYLPYEQAENDFPLDLVVRTNSQPESFATAITGAIHLVDPDQPVSNVTTMQAHLAGVTVSERFSAVLMGALATLGLALAVIGLYGVMAYSVSRQTGELGLRLALGAHPRDIFRMVLGRGARLVSIGLVLGLVGAVALARFLSGALYSVRANDPATFTIVVVFLAAVALAACYVPARRATRVDPIVALRYE